MHFMNDPNGLVFSIGLYHLYYQYNPTDASGGQSELGSRYQYGSHSLDEPADSHPRNDHRTGPGSNFYRERRGRLQ